MSIFVIDKKEYIKAAGIMYGVEKSKRFPHTYFLDVVRQKFNELYILNEKSVSIQYNEESCPDECEYIDTFWEYVEKSKQMLNDNRKELTFNMMIFFNSVLYQIEDEEMHMKASDFLYMCVRKLFKADEDFQKASDGGAWWGKVKK